MIALTTGSHPHTGTAVVATRLARKKVGEQKCTNGRCYIVFRGIHEITGFNYFIVGYILNWTAFWY